MPSVFSNTSPALGNALNSKIKLTSGGLQPMSGFMKPAPAMATPSPLKPSQPTMSKVSANQNIGGGLGSNGLYQASGTNAGIDPYKVGQPQQTPNQTAGISMNVPNAKPLADNTDFLQGMKANVIEQGNQSPAIAQAQKDPNSPFYIPVGSPYYTPPPSYGGLIGSLSNQSNSPYNQAAGSSISGLNNAGSQNQVYADRARDIANAAGQRISEIGQTGAKTAGGYLTTGTSPVAEGNAAILAQTTAAQQQAIAEGANMQLAGNAQGLTAQQQAQAGLLGAGGLANTGQSNVQGALYNAATLAAPVTQFGQITNPVTGQVVGASATGNNPLLESAVNNALGIIRSGGSYNDARATMAQFGQAGEQALLNKLGASGTGFNPTTQNAVAGQNAAQAIDYQGQATALDTSLKQLDNISTLAANFLQNEKLLNPTDNPDINSGINTYVGKFKNPANRLAYNAIIGDIKKFTSTILASNNGTIPTDVTNTLNSFDPSTLSAPQLVPYLQTLSQLGSNQLSVLQSQSKSSGGGGYSGAPAAVSTTPISAPPQTSTLGSQVNSPYVQAGIGGFMNFAGGLWHGIEGLASHLFGL